MNEPTTDEEYVRFVKTWDWAEFGAAGKFGATVPGPPDPAATEAGVGLVVQQAPAAPEQGALL